MDNWIDLKVKKPPCKRDPDALGTPVLIWPRSPAVNGQDKGSYDGFCYYGKRATGRPAFYLFGAEIHGVSHWQPMPDGPKDA